MGDKNKLVFVSLIALSLLVFLSWKRYIIYITRVWCNHGQIELDIHFYRERQSYDGNVTNYRCAELITGERGDDSLARRQTLYMETAYPSAVHI